LNVKCAYHPDKAAVSACSECTAPLCRECETLIKGKPVCQRCIANIRAKVGAELGAQGVPPPPGSSYPPPASPYPQQPGAYSPQPSSYPPQQGAPYGQAPVPGGTVYRAPSPVIEEPANPGKLALGVVAGLVVGIVGAIILEKIHIYAHFGLSILYIFVAIGIAGALTKVSEQSSPLISVLSVAVYFVSMLVSHYVYALDLVAAEAPGLPMSMDIFVASLKIFSPMHWIIIAIGAYSAFTTPMRMGGAE
jgi:hypothetical protein